MGEGEFKEKAGEARDAVDIDDLCIKWIRNAAYQQEPRVRDMILAASDVIKRGIEYSPFE